LIVFYNAEIVFFLKNYIRELFNDVHKPSNLLQKGVNYDIKEDFFIALCKALGLCSKFITAPFWRIMEGDCTLQETTRVVFTCILHIYKSSKVGKTTTFIVSTSSETF
jgi:hypothetical protein